MKRIYIQPEMQVYPIIARNHLLSMSVDVSSEAYSEDNMTDLASENCFDFDDE